MKKQLIFIMILIVIILMAIILSHNEKNKDLSNNLIVNKTTSTDVNDFSNTKVSTDYINTKYGFSLKYPQTMRIENSAELDRDPVTESSDFKFYKPGIPDYVGIEVWYPSVSENYKVFAKEIYDAQKNSTNPNLPKPVISELKETKIGGKDAEEFSITSGFEFRGHGYSLGDNVKYIYVITEDDKGYKYVIRYLSDDKEANTIIDSLLFKNQ